MVHFSLELQVQLLGRALLITVAQGPGRVEPTIVHKCAFTVARAGARTQVAGSEELLDYRLKQMVSKRPKSV